MDAALSCILSGILIGLLIGLFNGSTVATAFAFHVHNAE